jgi:hypothetical protein
VSRDGTKAVSGNTIVNVADGTSTPIPLGYYGYALDATGRHLVVADNSMSFGLGQLLVRDQLTGTATRATVPSAGNYYGPPWLTPNQDVALSADGSVIAYFAAAQSGPDAGHIRVIVGAVGGPAAIASEGLPNHVNNSFPKSISMSADGRYTSFAWHDTEFTCANASLANCDVSIFRFDRVTGRTERVDVNRDGTTGPALGGSPAMSDDGRFIAFYSDSPFLTFGLVGRHTRVFLRDMVRQQTWLVAETTMADPRGGALMMSGDGRRIVFSETLPPVVTPPLGPTTVRVTRVVDLADGSTLQLPASAAPGATYGPSPMYVDRRGEVVLLDGLTSFPPQGQLNATRVELSPSTAAATTITLPFDGTVDLTVVPTPSRTTPLLSLTPASSFNTLRMSRDGSTAIALGTSVKNFETGMTTPIPLGLEFISLDGSGGQAAVVNAAGQLFRRNVATGESVPVPFPVATPADPDIGHVGGIDSDASVVMSASGAVVAYTTWSESSLRGRGFVTAMDGTPVEFTKGLPSLAMSHRPSHVRISADGRFVSFVWIDATVGCTIPGDQCYVAAYRYDRVAARLERVDVAVDGSPTFGWASSPEISDDGRFVAFASWATTLVPGIASPKLRVHLRDMLNAKTYFVTDTELGSTELSLSGDARRLLYQDVSVLPSPIGPIETDVVRLVDLADGTVTQIGPLLGGLANGPTREPFVNQTGSVLVFRSGATNLIPTLGPPSSSTYRATMAVAAPTDELRLPSGAAIAVPRQSPDPSPPSRYVARSPERVLDTRAGGPVNFVGSKPLGGAVVEVPVPAGAAAAVLNVTGLDAVEAGFVTVFPCGEDRPNASNLNLVPGVVSPNLVISKVGANGKVCIFTEKSANLFADLAGTFIT